MAKYKRPAQHVVEEPTFFVKHYWRLSVEFVSKHKDEALTAALVVAVIVLGVVVWHRYAQARTASAWQEQGLLTTTAQLEAAARKYASTPVGPWLALSLGDRYYMLGDNDKAAREYSNAAAGAEGLLALRAKYSLSTAYESAGKFADAKAVLEPLSKESGFWGIKAAERLKALPQDEAVYRKYTALVEAAKAAAAKAAEAGKTAAAAAPAVRESREAGQAGEVAGTVSEIPAGAPGTDSALTVQGQTAPAAGAGSSAAVTSEAKPAGAASAPAAEGK